MSTIIQDAIRLGKERGVRDLASRAEIHIELTLGNSLPEGLDNWAFERSIEELNRHMSREKTVEDVLDTVFSYRGYGTYRSIEPMQIRSELRQLLELVRDEKPSTILEIGTARGGTLYSWARGVESAETIVSLDLPGGEFGGGYSQKRVQFFSQFRDDDSLSFVRRNSQEHETRGIVQEHFTDGVDFLLIDGDHRFEGVKRDFELYSPLVNDGGLIAFHDIADHYRDPDCQVDEFWNNNIEPEYDTLEIVEDEEQGWAGIGVVQW